MQDIVNHCNVSYIVRPVFLFLGLRIFTVMSNIGGGKKIMFYCHVKHRTGEKETREMKGERVNQCHLKKSFCMDYYNSV